MENVQGRRFATVQLFLRLIGVWSKRSYKMHATMTPILEQIKEQLPRGAKLKDIMYEGADIVLYTENAEFLLQSGGVIRDIVNKIKKRVEVRAAESILESQEKTEKLVKELAPAEAGIRDIFFEPEFSKVIVHAGKPGLVIGKAGEILRKIKEKTFWTPEVRRAPAIDSDIIKAVRAMLHKEAGYRRKFLHSIGERIYGPKNEIDWIRVTALGGFREVGRSCVLVSTNNSSALMDCGLSVSAQHLAKPYPYLEAPEFNIQKLDAVVISHAHLDHSGILPYLYEYGYRGPVYCTRPTRDLMILLQMDYMTVAQREGKKSPYTSKGIEEMIKHCITLEWGQVTDIAPDLRLTLGNAGHLLGSSCCHLNIGDGTFNLLYSGDIKYQNTKLFDRADPELYARVEGVIIESTYGDGTLPRYEDGEEKLRTLVRAAIQRGGRVLIPCFAVGRAQAMIATLMEDPEITVPVYLDGMIWDATAIHTAYPEYLSRYLQGQILRRQKNPFVDPRLKGIGSSEERRAVLTTSHPCIVLSTSGMLQGGPVMEYLKAFAGDPKNMLLFVGYQAEGTLGRRIQKGWKYIPVEGRDEGLELKLEVQTVEGYSGHSDQRELMAFIRALKTKPRKIIANHGEPMTISNFVRAMHRDFGVDTEGPKILETVRLK